MTADNMAATTNMLTHHETDTVQFQSRAAMAVKELYHAIALLSSRSVVDLVDVNQVEVLL